MQCENAPFHNTPVHCRNNLFVKCRHFSQQHLATSLQCASKPVFSICLQLSSAVYHTVPSDSDNPVSRIKPWYPLGYETTIVVCWLKNSSTGRLLFYPSSRHALSRENSQAFICLHSIVSVLYQAHENNKQKAFMPSECNDAVENDKKIAASRVRTCAGKSHWISSPTP